MVHHFVNDYILIGNTKSTDGDVTGLHGSSDIWAMKVNRAGEILWQKTYGGTGTDEARAFIEDFSATFLIVGKTTSNDGDVTGAHGSDDGWVLRINGTDGNIVWQKTIGTNLAESFFSVTLAYDGNYLLSGVKGTDAWLYKMNLSGDLVWEHTYGSSANEMAISVTPTADQGVIATGYTDAMTADGDVPATHGLLDVWVFKVDKQGTLQWSKTFGGSGVDYPWKAETSDNSYNYGAIITGYTTSNDGDVTGNHGGQDAWVINVDEDGTLLWQKTYGGSGTDGFTYVSPEEASDKFRLVGYTTSNDGDVTKNQGGRDAWYMQIVGNGDVIWQKTFGGSGDDYGTGIYRVGNFDFVATGSSASNDGDVSGVHGAMDAWMFAFQK